MTIDEISKTAIKEVIDLKIKNKVDLKIAHVIINNDGKLYEVYR